MRAFHWLTSLIDRQSKLVVAAASFSSKSKASALDYSQLENRQLLAADAVLQWNDVLLDAIRTDKTAPPMAARAMAMVHTAIHDAVNSIEHRYQSYGKSFVSHPQASLDAAIAAASERTLSAIFPAQHATFTAKLDDSLAAIADGIRETQGVAAGRFAADQILALRASDGAFAVTPYQPGTNPGEWRPTPPAYLSSLLPQWPNVTPWSLTRGDQFRPENPPALNSSEYAAAVNQVKSLGSLTSTTRTAEQANIAKVWAAGPGTATPPGQWNQIAADIARSKNLSTIDNARLFALLNVSLADAGIAAWDAKYATNLWRPISAIREADTDNNPATEKDAAWTPLITTPPFSAYVSGHSTFSGAGAAILSSFLGTDQVNFTLKSEVAGVPDRTFTSLAAAGDEAGMSRIYGGIHYIFDHTAGSATGKKIAAEALQSEFLPETKVTTWQDGSRLFVSGTTNSDQITLTRIGRNLVVFQAGSEVARYNRTSISHVVINGSDGNDRIDVKHSLDVTAEIFGGRGNDKVFGARMSNWIYGQAGDDMLCGGSELDLLRGGDGDDSLMGLAGLDRLFGDDGWNKLCGGLGNDELNCHRGKDKIIGKAGFDSIIWL